MPREGGGFIKGVQAIGWVWSRVDAASEVVVYVCDAGASTVTPADGLSWTGFGQQLVIVVWSAHGAV